MFGQDSFADVPFADTGTDALEQGTVTFVLALTLQSAATTNFDDVLSSRQELVFSTEIQPWAITER